MKIAICDDEKNIREFIAGKIKTLYPKEEILMYRTGQELLDGESAGNRADILFLDIWMPGQDGMEIARKLRRSGSGVTLIFITGMKDYVFQAFDVGAFHYLVKPFSSEQFYTVLKKAVEQSRNRISETVPDRQEERYIMVSQKGIHQKVKFCDVIYAEVFNRKITLHMTDGKMEYYGKLTELENMAGEDFFRTHRAYLIHFRYVVKYDSVNVWLEDGSRVLMAKGKYPEFVKQYLKYIQRNKAGG